jgi:hypothetical protein
MNLDFFSIHFLLVHSNVIIIKLFLRINGNLFKIDLVELFFILGNLKNTFKL